MSDRIVKFNDLKPSIMLQPELFAAHFDVLHSGNFILGEQVRLFEEEFAEYIGAKYCVGVGNGFDALYIAMRACDVGYEGEAVVVPSNAPLPTWMAVSETGAVPVPYDVETTTMLMPDSMPVHITGNSFTRTIVPVHLYGMPVDVEALRSNLPPWKIIIEDCAQSHGAMVRGKKTGSMGHIGCFSFYPTKNLGCYGDGGAIVCNDESIAEKARDLRFYGNGKYRGINSRLDELQAAYLRVKLRYLDEENDLRNQRANRYYANLHAIDEVLLPNLLVSSQDYAVWHQYVIRVERREELVLYLKDNGIDTMIHYGLPASRMDYYHQYQFATPNADWLSQHVLSLPIASVDDDQIDYVSETIRGFYK